MLNYQVKSESKQVMGKLTYPQVTNNDLSSAVSTNPQAISRLISAAIVDKTFCKLLLTSPESAIANGYRGETFDLTADDLALICTIQAKSIKDFAAQLIRLRETNCKGEWVVENRKPAANQTKPLPVPPKETWHLAHIQSI